MQQERVQDKISWKQELWSWIKVLIASLLMALFIVNVLIINAEVVSESMETTVMKDDRVLGSRLSYKKEGPQRFDVVIFRYPDDESMLYVKRVIGLPEDKVQIIDGKVYLNDSPEPLYDGFVTENPEGNYGPFYVPRGHYFLLGDNRNHSFDSKDWGQHFVARRKIEGKLMFIYWPFDHIGTVERIEA